MIPHCLEIVQVIWARASEYRNDLKIVADLDHRELYPSTNYVNTKHKILDKQNVMEIWTLCQT